VAVVAGAPVALRLRTRSEWHEAVHRHLLPLDRSAVEPQPFDCHAVVGRVGAMIVAELRSDASHMARRSVDLCEGEADYVKIVCQLNGRSRVQQGPNGATLDPGTWTVFDTSREYTVETSHGTRLLLILMPRSGCPGWVSPVQALGARALPGSGAANIVVAALTAMVQDAAPLDPNSECALHDLTIALIERALAVELKARGLEALVERATTLPQLQAYILEHLTDPRLSIVRVAAVFGISRRSLYNLFAPSGTTPHAFILRARLDRACALLNDPMARSTPVASIARKCGFADPAHFTRAFHARYGIAPTSWRSHAA
jgi:AraC-like DNA-binding protein